MDYVDLDLGSEYYKALSLDALVGAGKEAEAVRAGPSNIANWRASYSLLLACAGHRPFPEIATLASSVQPEEDPEDNYFSAARLAYCGQTEAAIQMLRRAIGGEHFFFFSLVSAPPSPPPTPQPARAP